MHLLALSLNVIAFLPGLSLAVPKGHHHHHKIQTPYPSGETSVTSTSTLCYTFEGYELPSTSPHTTWYTSKALYTSTTTQTVVVTTTPSATTSTVTVTATSTGATTSLTQTDTSTTTETETDTAVTTSTSTSTTTSTSTSTIPSSAGFIPVQSSLVGATYDGAQGADPVARKRFVLADEAHHEEGAPAEDDTGPALLAARATSKALYVYYVKCEKWVGKCKIQTVTTTVTSTASTPTWTTTTTVTSVTIPSATTTTTTTVTSTSTSTTTSTTTDTATSTVVSSTSVYAACATNNLADLYALVPIDHLAGGSPNQVIARSPDAINTAYDCCAFAFSIPNNAAEAWILLSPGAPQGCVVTVAGQGDTCSIQTQSQYTFPATAIVDGTSHAVGNGYCGVINQASIAGGYSYGYYY